MVKRLPALDIEGPPLKNPAEWRLRVDGLVEHKKEYTLDGIRSFEHVEPTAPFVCVEGWDMWVKWKGVLLRKIIEDVKPLPAAKFCTFYAYSEYTDSLSLEQARDGRTILAYGYEGDELPAENGGPLRLLVPFLFAYKSVKWLTRISFVDTEELGYWEMRGYPAEALIPVETKMKYDIL
jgi:DMSO/TMAO reductase YedYZ molybdopterin-dependent catalytic subunit